MHLILLFVIDMVNGAVVGQASVNGAVVGMQRVRDDVLVSMDDLKDAR